MDLSSYQTFIDTVQCDDRITNESLVLMVHELHGFDITITQRMVMGRLPIPGGICSLLPAKYNRTLLGNKVGWHKLYRVHFDGMILAEFHHYASCQLTDFIRGYFPLLISLASLDRLKDFRYRGRVRFIDAQPSSYMPLINPLAPNKPVPWLPLVENSAFRLLYELAKLYNGNETAEFSILPSYDEAMLVYGFMDRINNAMSQYYFETKAKAKNETIDELAVAGIGDIIPPKRLQYEKMGSFLCNSASQDILDSHRITEQRYREFVTDVAQLEGKHSKWKLADMPPTIASLVLAEYLGR